MLVPKKYKYRKVQRGVLKGNSKAGNKISFGQYGLVAMSSGFLTSRQIEATRVCINRFLKREGKLWIRIFPHKPISKRPAESRMGGGKGDIEFYAAVVEPGRVMFEIDGVSAEDAKKAFRKASFKLPVLSKFYEKRSV